MTPADPVPVPRHLSEEERALWEKATMATQGEREWFGNVKYRGVYLATVRFGRRFIMQFDRWGMGSAQPTFQTNQRMVKLSEFQHGNHNGDFVGINHPDAQFIAACSADRILSLLTALSSEREAGEEARKAIGERAHQADVIARRSCVVDLARVAHSLLNDPGFTRKHAAQHLADAARDQNHGAWSTDNLATLLGDAARLPRTVNLPPIAAPSTETPR